MTTITRTGRAAAVGAVGGALVVAVAAAALWAGTAQAAGPSAYQVAQYTEAAGAELADQGGWTDTNLLAAGNAVCGTDGPAGGAEQEAALRGVWSSYMDALTTVTIMHSANRYLCPAE